MWGEVAGFEVALEPPFEAGEVLVGAGGEPVVVGEEVAEVRNVRRIALGPRLVLSR